MHLQVTEEDIREANHNGIDSPVMRALQRATGDDWVVIEGYRYAYEISAPYRVIALSDEIIKFQSAWHNQETVAPLAAVVLIGEPRPLTEINTASSKRTVTSSKRAVIGEG